MQTDWKMLLEQARSLLDGETDPVANAANLCALLFDAVPGINWVGFYFLKDGELVVGPFQGKPACVRIPLGQGVCGTAAARRESVIVDDVHAFAGHIACDPDSNSEVVVPLLHRGSLLGVLDVDSPQHSRFDTADREGLESIARLYVESSSPRPTPSQGGPLGYFTLQVGDELKVFHVNDIDWIEADDYYTRLHIGGESHISRQTMSTLEAQLPADRFIRIHRSAIVNLRRVHALEPLFKGDYTVILQDGTRLRMSRRRRAALSDTLKHLS